MVTIFMDSFAKAYILNQNQTIPSVPLGQSGYGPAEGIPNLTLEAMNSHVKCFVARHFFNEIIQKSVITQGQHMALTPGGVESFARLLTYPEVELDRTKDLLNIIPPSNQKNNFVAVHLLSELFTFRLHRISTSTRVQLLQHLTNLLSIPTYAGHPQLYSA